MPQARLTILSIGADKFDWIEAGSAHYETLLRRYALIDQRIIAPPKRGTTDPAAAKKLEAGLLLPALEKLGVFIALSDNGRSFTSVDFSAWLTATVAQYGGKLTFVIGGAHGLDGSVLSRAAGTISLSPLTFSHQLVRLVLFEQLFRGFSIAAGSPYHR